MKIKQNGTYKRALPFIKHNGVYKAVQLYIKKNGVYTMDLPDFRYAYNFDGVDDRVVLAKRAINPDGDNNFVFWSPENTAGLKGIIGQSIGGTGATREFSLYVDPSLSGGSLIMNFGGTFNNLCTVAEGFEFSKKYFLNLVGTTFTLAKNTKSNIIKTGTFSKGATREPTAPTVIGSISAGSGSYASFFKGPQFDVEINGTVWKLDERNQLIQLPLPLGLGAELITPTVLENPAIKGSQWTYLGGGRWQYVGNGTLNTLELIVAGDQPAQGYLEFEVESITGIMTCAVSNSVQGSFNVVGIKRYFYTAKGASSENAIVFKRLSGIASCIIKNISFKPLNDCNPATIVNFTSDRWFEQELSYPLYNTRYAYNFDGVDDRFIFSKRLINPDGDIDISWTQRGISSSGVRTIISQSSATASGDREFDLRWDNGKLGMIVGGFGVFTVANNIISADGTWRVLYKGSAVTVYYEGSVVHTATGRNRGIAREPSASTRIGQFGSGSQYLMGYLYNIRTPDYLWSLSERNQPVQLSQPSGLGAELLNTTIIETPPVKGVQWTYLGDGRWQYIGDGTLNTLGFLTGANRPTQGFIEFEVESITGEIRCSADNSNVLGSRTFVTTGVKRAFWVNNPADLAFARNGTSVASCIIKNISIKPLGTANPLTGANITTERWKEILE